MTIAIQKVTDILELFLSSHDELSLAELSKLSGLNKSTVYRIASYLVNKGYLRQLEKRGKYSLGMKFLDFAAVIKERMKIREIALRYLAELKQIVWESCGLVIWDGKEATLIDIIHNNSVLRVSPDEVSRLPLHPTSCGKIFLANMPEKQREKYFEKGILTKFTDRTIVNPIKLRKELVSIKKDGLAFDVGEHIVGTSSVGAEIKDANGKVIAAVVVVAPTVRLPLDKLEAIAPSVKKCAMDISHGLGWEGN